MDLNESPDRRAWTGTDHTVEPDSRRHVNGIRKTQNGGVSRVKRNERAMGGITLGYQSAEIRTNFSAQLSRNRPVDRQPWQPDKAGH